MTKAYVPEVQNPARDFRIRAETRLKNGALAQAREQLGLNCREVSEKLQICYSSYCRYESMQEYPTSEKQKKICQYFRGKGIPLFEDEVFPPQLATTNVQKKYIQETTISPDRLLPLHTINERLLPPAENEALENLRLEEIREVLLKQLSTLSPRKKQIATMLYGLDGKPPMSAIAVANELNITYNAICSSERELLKDLRHPSRTKMLINYL